MMNKNNSSDEIEYTKKGFFKQPIILFTLTVILSIILAVAFFFTKTSLFPDSDFNTFGSNKEQIIGVNNSVGEFISEDVITENDNQESDAPKDEESPSLDNENNGNKENIEKTYYALGLNQIQTTPASFNFSTRNVKPNAKNLDVYLDFSNQQARDFFMINKNVLEGLVSTGQLNIRVYIIPNNNAINAYSSEALALSFSENSENSWKLLYELLENAATEKSMDADEIRENIAKKAQDVQYKNVTSEEIQKGLFSQWLLTVKDDERLYTGYSNPLLFVNNVRLDADDINFNNPETMFLLLKP